MSTLNKSGCIDAYSQQIGIISRLQIFKLTIKAIYYNQTYLIEKHGFLDILLVIQHFHKRIENSWTNKKKISDSF